MPDSLGFIYVQVTFKCLDCGQEFVRIFTGFNHVSIMARISNTVCSDCIFRYGESDVDVLDMVDLPIQHLEEFMVRS